MCKYVSVNQVAPHGHGRRYTTECTVAPAGVSLQKTVMAQSIDKLIAWLIVLVAINNDLEIRTKRRPCVSLRSFIQALSVSSLACPASEFKAVEMALSVGSSLMSSINFYPVDQIRWRTIFWRLLNEYINTPSSTSIVRLSDPKSTTYSSAGEACARPKWLGWERHVLQFHAGSYQIPFRGLIYSLYLQK
jgi:hypothetical protein